MAMRLIAPMLVVLLGVAPALAGTADEDLETAVQHFWAGDFIRSRQVLAAAAKKTTDARTLARIELYQGLNAAVSGNDDDAAARFVRALRLDPELTLRPSEVKRSLMERFESVRAGLRGELLVASVPSGVAITVDGKAVGSTPLALKLLPGAHVVEAQPTDSRHASSRAKAVVKVEGRSEVTLRLPELRSESSPVPAPALVQPQAAVSTGTEPRHRLWTWITLGGAVAAAATAGGLYASASSDHDAFFSTKEGSPEEAEVRGRAEDKLTATNVLAATAGVLAAGAVVLFFLEGRTPREEAQAGVPRVSPLVGAASGGILLDGRF